MIPIANFEKRYTISEDGVVMNLANNTPLKPILQENGYLYIGLAKGNSTHHQEGLHTLVARHFLPNPYGYTQVNHKNGIKTDCHKDNLEWCSAQQNINHALLTRLRPGYMSADDKECYLYRVLAGEQVNDIALQINRHPNTLHKMLRDTAKRLNIFTEWQLVMKENRTRAALQQLAKINNKHSIKV